VAWSLPFLLMPFSSVFYPESVLPPFARAIAQAIPANHVFEGMRALVSEGRMDWGRLGLATGPNLLYLGAVIVGGGLGDRLGQPFVDRIVEQMTPHLFVSHNPPVVLRTELGDLSGAVGAAVLAGG